MQDGQTRREGRNKQRRCRASQMTNGLRADWHTYKEHVSCFIKARKFYDMVLRKCFCSFPGIAQKVNCYLHFLGGYKRAWYFPDKLPKRRRYINSFYFCYRRGLPFYDCSSCVIIIIVRVMPSSSLLL